MKQLINSLLVLAFLAPVSALAETVRCESKGGLKECEMDTRGEVRMARQLSRASCIEGRTWGVNRHTVWVKDGCRAEFESGGGGYGYGGGSSASGARDWDRGCSDAKVGSYDRSGHATEAYESGWQSCKNQNNSSGNGPRDWDNGCRDAKAGTYNRAHHNQAYEEGWQACKRQSNSYGGQESSRSREATSAAETACMVAANSEYGGRVRNLQVVSSEFSQANSTVILNADGERWRCLVSNDGSVIEELTRQR